MAADFAIIIPARYASTRYPGKPLVRLKGATGVEKTLIQRSWECARAVPGSSGVWVATDDERIAAEVRGFGGQVVMTSMQCANGTERCAEAASRTPGLPDIIVNLQGDAPLTPAHFVPTLVELMALDEQVAMATPAVRCSASVHNHLVADAAAGRVGGTTVVFNSRGRALYFSKRIIPYVPLGTMDVESIPVYLHLGLYAYRQSALTAYKAASLSDLERFEGLEQLRFLDLDMRVSVLRAEALGWAPIELNNPGDLPLIEQSLMERGIA